MFDGNKAAAGEGEDGPRATAAAGPTELLGATVVLAGGTLRSLYDTDGMTAAEKGQGGSDDEAWEPMFDPGLATPVGEAAPAHLQPDLA